METPPRLKVGRRKSTGPENPIISVQGMWVTLYKQPEQMFPRARTEQDIRVHYQALDLKTLGGIQRQHGLWSASPAHR